MAQESHSPLTGLALFDLDNTLLDRRAYARWAHFFVAQHGLGEDAVSVLCDADDEGMASRHAVFSTARQVLGIRESIEDLEASYRVHYPEFIQPDQVILSAVQQLRAARWRVGIVTNGPPTQREKIQRAGLATLMDGVCISEELGIRKPDPRIFDEAIRQCCTHAPPRDAIWMVGDAPLFDIGGGRAAGLKTAWLHHGRTWSERDFSPDIVASDVVDAVHQLISVAGAPRGDG